jgi:hypothetical protein
MKPSFQRVQLVSEVINPLLTSETMVKSPLLQRTSAGGFRDSH